MTNFPSRRQRVGAPDFLRQPTVKAACPIGSLSSGREVLEKPSDVGALRLHNNGK